MPFMIHRIYYIPIIQYSKRYLTVRKQFIDSKSAHDNEGNINFGPNIEEIGVVLGYHLEFLHNLGNLVGIVLDVSHHKIVFLGDDVPRYVKPLYKYIINLNHVVSYRHEYRERFPRW